GTRSQIKGRMRKVRDHDRDRAKPRRDRERIVRFGMIRTPGVTVKLSDEHHLVFEKPAIDPMQLVAAYSDADSLGGPKPGLSRNNRPLYVECRAILCASPKREALKLALSYLSEMVVGRSDDFARHVN